MNKAEMIILYNEVKAQLIDHNFDAFVDTVEDLYNEYHTRDRYGAYEEQVSLDHLDLKMKFLSLMGDIIDAPAGVWDVSWDPDSYERDPTHPFLCEIRMIR